MHSHINIESVLDKRTMTLPEDQSLDIEESNPLFNDVEMMSYPVEFPFDYNRGVFKNLDDRDSDLKASDVEGGEFRIMVDGLPFRTTVLHVQEDEVLKDRIPVNFDSRTRTFKDMLTDLKCREVPVKDDIKIGEKVGDISVSFQLMQSITTTIPISLKNWTTTSWVIRSMKLWMVAVSPLIRLITAPVEVLS